MKNVRERIVDPQGSQHKGLHGLYETLLRRFKTSVSIITLTPIYLIAVVCLGLSMAPGLWVFNRISAVGVGGPVWQQYLASGLGLASGYFTYGFSLILVAPTLNFILNARPTEWRGAYYSLAAVKWFLHNGLTYLVRYTFLEFITPTPLNLLFYRLMGMKIGQDVQLNSTHISDPRLITLGDRVTIGGSANIVAHYGQGGFLVIAPVVIGKGVTIGLRATIMGGVEIGVGAKVLPNSVVLPKTKIPAGETWGGVPAKKVETASFSELKSSLKAAKKLPVE